MQHTNAKFTAALTLPRWARQRGDARPDELAVRVLNGDRGTAENQTPSLEAEQPSNWDLTLAMREALRRPVRPRWAKGRGRRARGRLRPLRPGEADRLAQTVREYLCAYASTWIESGPLWGTWARANLQQAREVLRAAARIRLAVEVFHDGGAMVVDRSPANAPEVEAARLFLSIAAGPRPGALRPCRREGCGHYFLATTKRKRAYCSPECARYVSATAATRRNRKSRFARKLEFHLGLIERWNRMRRRRGDPRKWIKAHRGSLHFLTRHAEELPELMPGNN